MNRPPTQDTIVALATPPGYGAIAVIRLDGPQASRIMQRLTNHPESYPPRQAQLSAIYDRDELVDQVIITFFAQPHSYTGNDLFEISCHGNPYIVDRVVNLTMTYGARLAHPGEFTQRAFLNGKMSLLQAEAVAELVFANHQLAHQSSIAMLTGSLGEDLQSLRNQLVDMISILELELDFADQEINPTPAAALVGRIQDLLREISALIASYSFGRIVREGALVPIVGPANSGKSSLLNALIMEDRAIVTPVPGTTRDYIEGTYHKDGLLFRLIDTAGLRPTDDPVEKFGIERTHQLIQMADLVLYVLDLTVNPETVQIEIADHDRPAIVILNKLDVASPSRIKAYQAKFQHLPHVTISAKRHQNLKALATLMVAQIKQKAVPSQQRYITVKRHYEALRKTRQGLTRAKRLLRQQAPSEVLVAELRWALEQLDTILGKTFNESILNNIFSHFCIGK